jgi:type IV pilus assembly protein PilM
MINQKSNYPIGLDISDLSLKFVQLNKRKSFIEIQSFSKISLQKGWIEGGEIKNRKKVLNSIKSLIDNSKFGKASSNQVVSCLPESATFIKLIKIEGEVDNLEEAIIFELNKHIPMSIDDVYYDYQIVKNTKDEKLVIFGACPKKIVDQYIDLLKEAKLSIMAMEIESVAISRSLLLEESPYFNGKRNKNYIIVDIGANRSSVFVYSQNTILFDVSIPVSGQDISNKISKDSKIESDKADLAKIVCGLDGKKCKGVIKNNLSKMIEKLVSKVEGVIEYYNSHFSEYGELDEILLCGGGANIQNIDKVIQDKTSITTRLGNPFANLHQPTQVSLNLSKPQEIFVGNFIETYKLNLSSIQGGGQKKGDNKFLSAKQDSSITYVTAIGLALRNIFLD